MKSCGVHVIHWIFVQALRLKRIWPSFSVELRIMDFLEEIPRKFIYLIIIPIFWKRIVISTLNIYTYIYIPFNIYINQIYMVPHLAIIYHLLNKFRAMSAIAVSIHPTRGGRGSEDLCPNCHRDSPQQLPQMSWRGGVESSAGFGQLKSMVFKIETLKNSDFL